MSDMSDKLVSHKSVDFGVLVDQMAIVLNLPIAPDHRPGVIANLERTATIAQLVMDFPLPDQVEAAPTFQP